MQIKYALNEICKCKGFINVIRAGITCLYTPLCKKSVYKIEWSLSEWNISTQKLKHVEINTLKYQSSDNNVSVYILNKC